MPSTSIATPPRRTQLERRTDAEQGLLNAAVQVFAAKGIDRTSLADIGEVAGYSRGLVNHHFGSKAALVERLAEQSQRRFVAGLAALDETDEVDALIAIADAYLRTVEEATDELRAFFVMWGAALPDDATLRSVFVADDRRFREGIEQLVVTGRGRGAIRADLDAAGFAVSFVGLLRGAAVQFLIDRDGVDLGATRVACESVLRAALTSSSSRSRK